MRQAVPFFGVSNIEASARFYCEGLGFEMVHKWIDQGRLRWCWLRLGDAALMLQEFRQDGHEPWIPEGKPGIGVTIYFICRDALAIYRALVARGIEARRPFVGNGMWVTKVTDTDGYSLCFESPTDAPEERVLD